MPILNFDEKWSCKYICDAIFIDELHAESKLEAEEKLIKENSDRVLLVNSKRDSRLVEYVYNIHNV